MRIRAYILLVAIAAVFVTTVCLPSLASTATKSVQKEYGEPRDDKALAYFIRAKSWKDMLEPLFLYVNDEVFGVLARNCYTYTYLDPGERVLRRGKFLDRRFKFESGKTYYFTILEQILDLPQEEGKRLIENVKSYCKATVQIVEAGEPLLIQLRNENFIRAYEGTPRNENEVAKVVQSWTTLTDVDDIRVRLRPPKGVNDFRKWERR